MLVKTSELTGAALDWAVAKCEGRRIEHNYQYTEETKFDGWWQLGPNHWQPLNKYSTDWAQGGSIIEREGMDLNPHGIDSTNGKTHWRAAIQWLDESDFEAIGQTPLIAAMRCYVASKLGDEVEIPNELKG